MNPKEELRSIVNSGRIPNSLLFQGPDGSGKLQAAIEFASNVLNIGAPSATNIIEKISHPDLHIIFPILNQVWKSTLVAPLSAKWVKNGLKLLAAAWSTQKFSKMSDTILKNGVAGRLALE